MEQIKQELSLIQNEINESFPNENDLKGFLGISKDLIINSLNESETLLINLKGYDNHLEVIILKRELTDLFKDIRQEIKYKFDSINKRDFNTVLNSITKIKFLIRSTYIEVVKEPIKTEAQLIKAKEELLQLELKIDELTKTSDELKAVKDSTVQSVSIINDEIKVLRDSSSKIVADFEIKQKTSIENEQKIKDFLTKIETHNSAIETIDKNTILWEAEIKKAKDDIVEKLAEYETISTKSKATKAEIESAHEKVYGKKDTDGKITKGYIQDIEEFKSSATKIVTDFEIKQKTSTENEQKIKDFLTKIDTHKIAIETIDKNTTLWEGEIKKSKEDILARSTEYEELTSKFKVTKSEIEAAYEKIYGKKEADGKTTNGYFQEIEDLKTKITLFIEEQQKTFKALFAHIESLLPGATSAGLAKAFEDQRKSYRWPIVIWSTIFILVTTTMTVCAIYIFYLQFLSAKTGHETLTQGIISLLKDIPFFIPTIWLAVFASKQQSQYKRLQQEYIFKETNAKSFHGHKRQIEELMKEGIADKELLLRLVAQLVVITSKNPSDTLDNKTHNDSPPLFKLIENIFPSLKKNKEEEKK